MHNEIIDKMRETNYNAAKDISDKIIDLINPIREKMEWSEKWDEVLIVNIYVRKGNDVLTQWIYQWVTTTSYLLNDLIRCSRDIQKVALWVDEIV